VKWYGDDQLVSRLPLRYRAYAAYSRLAGSRDSRRVVGGSFLLRILRRISHATGLGTVVPVRGIGGLVVYADFNDERILDVIHEIRGENPEYRVMSQLLKPSDTFVDVGANFGTFSLLASRLVGDHGKVIAIEPQPRLADLISKSLKASEVMNCEIIREACGSEAGSAELLVPVDDSGRAGMFAGFSGRWRHERVSGPAMVLDDLLDAVGSSSSVMVKIDVEGSEFAVLEGGRKFINSLRPSLLIEINPWTAKAAGRTTEELMDLLTSCGYKSFTTINSFPTDLGAGEIDMKIQSNIVARF
jgi:FkbM family methyltransferase